jgi:hypothetical protein
VSTGTSAAGKSRHSRTDGHFRHGSAHRGRLRSSACHCRAVRAVCTVRQDLGFAELGAANPDGAGRHLPLGAVRIFVGFSVRPKPHPVAPRERRHRIDVAGQCVKVMTKTGVFRL